jgi:CelD/BcsL family acetyltransferase involved in cellulose biosynthesis
VIEVREATPAEVRDWDAMVARFPNRRVVHERAWVQSLAASGYGTPLFLVFVRRGAVLGCLPGLRVALGPFRVFGSPLAGWQTVSMGPAFDPAEASAAELVTPLLPYLEVEHRVVHVELMSPELDAPSMAALDFRCETAPTYRVPLYPDDERRMWQAMKDSARRNVRRAERLGLRVVLESGDAFVQEHYAQLKEVYLHGGHTVNFSERRVFEHVRHLEAAGRLLALSVYLPASAVPGAVRDVSIATATFTMDGRELLLWAWAHRLQYRWYRPTELLTWTAMRTAAHAGCHSLDFMGRGDFKAKFGAELDETKCRCVRSRYHWVTWMRDMAERGLRLRQSVMGQVGRLAARRAAGTNGGGVPAPGHAGNGVGREPAA